MSTNYHTIELSDICLDIIHKDIKNLHLSVHPPQGRVTISAPFKMDLETIRLFSISKLKWIKKQQIKLKSQKRESPREYINRESHYYLGQRYLLKIIESNTPQKVVLKHKTIELYVRKNATKQQKEKLLQKWYRTQLKDLIKLSTIKLEQIMNVEVSNIGVRSIKTKWGTCNTKLKKIWLNTELAKKSIESIEYVLAHEMTHLLERNHNDRFIAYMDQFVPKWRHIREELNRSSLGYIKWND